MRSPMSGTRSCSEYFTWRPSHLAMRWPSFLVRLPVSVGFSVQYRQSLLVLIIRFSYWLIARPEGFARPQPGRARQWLFRFDKHVGGGLDPHPRAAWQRLVGLVHDGHRRVREYLDLHRVVVALAALHGDHRVAVARLLVRLDDVLVDVDARQGLQFGLPSSSINSVDCDRRSRSLGPNSALISGTASSMSISTGGSSLHGPSVLKLHSKSILSMLSPIWLIARPRWVSPAPAGAGSSVAYMYSPKSQARRVP